MECDEPPSEEAFPNFLYLMPSTIKGFNLKTKKWLEMRADNIDKVVWNDEAFRREPGH